MCGILAVLGVYRGGESIRDRVLERSRRLRHRGPGIAYKAQDFYLLVYKATNQYVPSHTWHNTIDWSGIHVKGKNIIAHERLAIVGVDSGGQPLYNEKKTCVLAVNGEIYNHKVIQNLLKNPSTQYAFFTCFLKQRYVLGLVLSTPCNRTTHNRYAKKHI